jgi:hypothetical protein
MNGAHWHLVLNHLPIILPIVGLIVLLSGLFLNSAILKRTALPIFIGAALATIAVF